MSKLWYDLHTGIGTTISDPANGDLIQLQDFG